MGVSRPATLLLTLSGLAAGFASTAGACIAAPQTSAVVPVVSSPAPLSEPEAIYERAREVWTNLTYPSQLQYVVTVRVLQRGVQRTNHYASRYTSDDGLIDTDAFSAEEKVNPYVTRGINVALAINGFVIVQLNRDPPPTDYLGVPILTPAYSFGLARRPVAATAASPSAVGPNLTTIGSVSTRQRDYVVDFASTESCNGVGAYHILLRPLHDPKRYRLREMWIDEVSYATLKLVEAGNFTSGPSVDVAWTIEFKQIDGVPYVVKEVADAPLDFGHGRRYERAMITFDSIDTSRAGSAFLMFRHPPRPDELREPGT